ncbi:hypothetical protein [Polyangium sp. 15x6]|uniref:hypothetical protein n=1 Tax=Polyangium sp. 15x6 TaxID=3042687 RepID=UPI00249CB6D5|nr:hypothetical protein [Polyangium sp. 15x6]MDI3288316.1 hypothetical protein [Polyangium sp. 15x6]
MTQADVRKRLVEALEADLVGPFVPDAHSKRGTEVAAFSTSYVESAKLCGLDPKAYLRTAVMAALRGERITLPHEVAAARWREENSTPCPTKSGRRLQLRLPTSERSDMRQFLFGLSFSVVFMIGCAVGTLQARQVAIANEPAPPGVKQWEIRCYSAESMGGKLALYDGDGLQEWNNALGKLGAAGWEPAWFVDANGYGLGVCMKRPKP